MVAIIFSQDKKNAELFIADEKESVILKRTGNKGNYIWKNTTYALSVSDKYVLMKGNKIIYINEENVFMNKENNKFKYYSKIIY